MSYDQHQNNILIIFGNTFFSTITGITVPFHFKIGEKDNYFPKIGEKNVKYIIVYKINNYSDYQNFKSI